MDSNLRTYPALRPRDWAALTLLLLWLGISSPAQVAVLTHHNDPARTGQYVQETLLTPAVVNVTHFGKLFQYTVDGMVIGQPLYVPNLPIAGNIHNVVFVATLHNNVYAFDADRKNGGNAAPLWLKNMGTPGPISEQGCGSVVGFDAVGIVGTPTIDLTTGTMYLVAKSKTNGKYIHKLHALDITTGADKPGSPVVIRASYESNGNVVTFTNRRHLQRTALLLANGVVYVGFGTMGCQQYPPSTGWLMAYSANDLHQLAVLDVGPTQNALPGLWMSGDGPSADAAGGVYVVTGDGLFDYNLGGLDFGNTVLRLSLAGGVFGVADYFTPYNQADLTARDLDLGSSGMVALPDQPGPFPHLGLAVGKQGTMYLLNRDNLGQYNPSGDVVVQEVPFNASTEVEIFGGATYWNNLVYFGARHSRLEAFSLSNGLLSNSPVAITTDKYNPSSLLSVSANGNQDGILWAIEKITTSQSILDAFQATDLKFLYGSDKNPSRDAIDGTSHFVLPTIANGRVYVGTADKLVVMGLLSKIRPVAGNSQTGLVNSELPNELTVTVKDIYTGNPVAGVTVSFSDGGAGGSFTNLTAVTSDAGVASTRYTLPPQPGVYTISATNLNYITANFKETATGN